MMSGGETSGMSKERGEEENGEGKRERAKVARSAEEEKEAEGTRQTRVTWLGLGEEWGVVRDVRKMIYKLLTPLERVTVERAHGVDRVFERDRKRVCEWAAQAGHLEVLRWARVNGFPWTESTCRCAARGGHLEILQWARANGCPWDAYTCSSAAVGGHLEVLQWARAKGCRMEMRKHAGLQRLKDIWNCCNGLVRTDVHGIQERALLQQEEDT